MAMPAAINICCDWFPHLNDFQMLVTSLILMTLTEYR